ncbi:MAG: hypothetical protein WCK35_22745 [Chloroflexota bacterium]
MAKNVKGEHFAIRKIVSDSHEDLAYFCKLVEDSAGWREYFVLWAAWRARKLRTLRVKGDDPHLGGVHRADHDIFLVNIQRNIALNLSCFCL